MKPVITAVLAVFMLRSALYASVPTTRKQSKLSTHKAQRGVASWYGGKEQGHRTASGEPFNEHQLTAAHRTLPFGTRVKVTNLRNGRSVVVKIKDRGPAIPNRVIDISKAAAEQLGFTHQGLAPVRIRVVNLQTANPRMVRLSEKTKTRLPAARHPA